LAIEERGKRKKKGEREKGGGKRKAHEGGNESRRRPRFFLARGFFSCPYCGRPSYWDQKGKERAEAAQDQPAILGHLGPVFLNSLGRPTRKKERGKEKKKKGKKRREEGGGGAEGKRKAFSYGGSVFSVSHSGRGVRTHSHYGFFFQKGREKGGGGRGGRGRGPTTF